MRTVPFPLVGGAYADETRPWSMQDTVNYLPTMAERDGTRSPVMLKTPPGLRPYLEIPGTGGGEEPFIPSKPVRGTYEAEGKFFAVIGTTLYRISNTGIAIPLGTVPGLGRVTFAHNQIPLGNEVVVMNGSAGYCYNTVTDTFARITDPGFPGSATAGFIDGYILGIEPQGRYAFNSRPAAATDYNTLDRFTSEVSPDRLVAQAVTRNELLLLSTSTGEFFENQGHSEQPFRSKRITMDKGCAGPYTVVPLDNSVCWLGSDGAFYRLDGYSPRRISTRPIEQAIRGLDWWQAFGFKWHDAGYEVAYWTFPDGRTWGWDAANNEWHRRESYELNRWRVNTMTRWNDKWYAGDFQTGRIWELDWAYVLEGDKEFISERTCAVMHDNQNLVRAPRLELVMDTGQQETVPVEFPEQPVGPSITGSAPDGDRGVPYEFSYTVTPGDAPVIRTVIRSGTLLPGISWDELTATLSGTTPDGGSMELELRTIDANGLYADHSDTIHFMGTVLWDPETETGGALDFLDGGLSIRAATNTAGYATADTSVEDGNWYWETTTGWYLNSGSLINHYGAAGIIRLSDSAYGLVMMHIGVDSAAGATASGNVLFSPVILDPDWILPANVEQGGIIRHHLRYANGVATWSVALDDGGWVEVMTEEEGQFAPYAISRGTNQDFSGEARIVYIYSRPDDFTYEIPDGAKPLGLAVVDSP